MVNFTADLDREAVERLGATAGGGPEAEGAVLGGEVPLRGGLRRARRSFVQLMPGGAGRG